jgi:hypothetical protein
MSCIYYQEKKDESMNSFAILGIKSNITPSLIVALEMGARTY